MELDKLEIVIEAKSDNATKSIKNLKDALVNLSKISRNIDIAQLDKLYLALKDISEIKFTNIIKLYNSIAKMQNALLNVSNITQTITTSLEKTTQEVDNILGKNNLEPIAKKLSFTDAKKDAIEIVKVLKNDEFLKNLQDAGIEFNKIETNAEGIIQKMELIGEPINEGGTDLENIRKKLQENGYELDKVVEKADGTKTAFVSVWKTIDRITKELPKLNVELPFVEELKKLGVVIQSITQDQDGLIQKMVLTGDGIDKNAENLSKIKEILAQNNLEIDKFNAKQGKSTEAIVRAKEEIVEVAEELPKINLDLPFSTELEKLGIVIQDITKSSSGEVEKFSLLKDKVSLTNDELEKLKEILEKNGYSIDKFNEKANGGTKFFVSQQKAILSNNKALQQTSKTLKQQKNIWDKLQQSMKRIMFYRFVRGIYQAIESLVKSSFSGLYDLSDTLNSAFADSLDGIKSSFVYLANSITSLIAPVLETLAPIIITITDAVAELINQLSMMIAIGFGASEITQATKELIKYKQATTTLGIDELNVVNQDSSYSSMFDIFANLQQETNGFITLLSKVATLIQQFLSSDELVSLLQKVFNLVFKIIDAIGNAGIDKVVKSVLVVVEQLLDVVSDIISVITPLIEPLMSLLSPVLEWLSSVVDYIGAILIPFESISTALQPLIQAIGTLFQTLKPLFELVFGALTWVNEECTLFFTALFKTIAELVRIVSAVVETFMAVLTFDFDKIGQIWGELCSGMQERWETIGKNIANFFIGIVNGIATAIEWFINKLIDALNFVLTPISAIVEMFGGTWSNISHISIGRIPTLSTGGIVEDGLFMANHNELVGGFGSKTAVANNEQITQGIYQAVKEALQESGFSSNGNEQTIQVILNGKEIASQVKKIEKENGVSIYGGSLSYSK